ncbi:TRAP transporter small permease [Desulfovibrio mangrovi]|uniref:TRAP transporter small permease n=1 Tax=Desulfovibrio mangrovi TaxID=2976983 RepID=UPI00224735C2|nr:TRAP transporter small permease [Desulfovibrio mangrovi]UZP66254.1 TRAP transporter small permease [Desulfovibrio mangrovi]
MIKFVCERFEELLGSALLFVMVSIAFINVITRYCIKMSLAWTEEITVNLFVWVVLLGTAFAFRKDSHLGVTMFYDALPKWGQRICYVVFLAASLGFFAVLFYLGLTEVRDEIDLEVTTESLAIPVWWYTIATPAFSLLIIIRILQRVWHDWRNGNI